MKSEKGGKAEIIFILDRSGSMAGLESDTIGGYNAMLKKQQKEPGEALVTTVLFDDQYRLLHDRTDIQAILPLTEKEYEVGGCTALLDAIGKTILKIANSQKHIADSHRSDRVLFVITTDGMENASREFTLSQIRQMIETHKVQYNWEFLFLGANIDAVATAREFGISADRAANYHPDSAGTELNYMAVSEAVSEMRATGHMDASWKKKIDEDFKKRGKN